jgi:hypothetical protein
MNPYKHKRLWFYRAIAFILGPLFLTGCGDDNNPIIPPLTLLDVTQQLAANGCASSIFTGQAGASTRAEATGPANENPDLFILDPNGVQIASATNPNLGTESLGFSPTVTGGHTVQVCDANNVGGAVRVVVTQQR